MSPGAPEDDPGGDGGAHVGHELPRHRAILHRKLGGLDAEHPVGPEVRVARRHEHLAHEPRREEERDERRDGHHAEALDERPAQVFEVVDERHLARRERVRRHRRRTRAGGQRPGRRRPAAAQAREGAGKVEGHGNGEGYGRPRTAAPGDGRGAQRASLAVCPRAWPLNASRHSESCELCGPVRRFRSRSASTHRPSPSRRARPPLQVKLKSVMRPVTR